MTQIQTHKLRQEVPFVPVAVPRSAPVIGEALRPYRIGLRNQDFRSMLVFELRDQIVIGRECSTDDAIPHIDLQPYNALELGVSRRHAILKREGEDVFLIDNNSANGVLLNHETLRREIPYLVRDGDIVKLGLMSLQLVFLINPYLAR